MIFTVAFRNSAIHPAPKAGDIVTFSYENYTRRAVPVNPKLVRTRFDLSWKQVVAEYFRIDSARTKDLNGIVFAPA